MKRTLLYTQTYWIRPKLSINKLREACKERYIKFEKTEKQRVYTFYAEHEYDLRWLQDVLLLNPYINDTN